MVIFLILVIIVFVIGSMKFLFEKELGEFHFSQLVISLSCFIHISQFYWDLALFIRCVKWEVFRC